MEVLIKLFYAIFQLRYLVLIFIDLYLPPKIYFIILP